MASLFCKFFNYNKWHRFVLAIMALMMALVFAINNDKVAYGKDNEHLKLAVTTSFEDSGLAELIVPAFKKTTGITVDVIAVGTGQALHLLQKGDVDACLVHSRIDEDRLVAEGYAASRSDIMYNDFVIVGPEDDPAGIAASNDIKSDIKEVMHKLVANRDKINFISRGDNSGTHKRELALWQAIDFNVENQTDPTWYKATGSGMGATLNTAAALNAYTLIDRGTWLKSGNKGKLKILFQGPKELKNEYGYLIISADKFPTANIKAAESFGKWLVGKQAQTIISNYKLMGQQLFFPNALNHNKIN